MAGTKTAALSGLLVSKQGVVSRRPDHPGLEAAQTPHVRAQDNQEGVESSSSSAQVAYYKALTLKVDRERFTKLKNLGVQRDLRSQALMTEALDLLFAKHQL